MSKQPKTIPEMEAEIRQLQQTMALPGIPEDEREIYLDTIQRIRAAIARQQRPETTANQPARTQPEPAQRPVTPMRVIKAGEPTPPSPIGDGGRGGEALANAHITARLDATPPTVTIEWPDDWGTQTYRESDVRSRFTSALRDLAQSRYARQQRFEILPSYLTWWRAKAWYRALCQFWPHPPGLAELGITRPGNAYRNIFYLITTQ